MVKGHVVGKTSRRLLGKSIPAQIIPGHQSNTWASWPKPGFPNQLLATEMIKTQSHLGLCVSEPELKLSP